LTAQQPQQMKGLARWFNGEARAAKSIAPIPSADLPPSTHRSILLPVSNPDRANALAVIATFVMPGAD